MSSEELWKAVERLHILPETAIEQIPDLLTDPIKERLSQLSPTDAGSVVADAVDEINCGSIATLDTLIKKRL